MKRFYLGLIAALAALCVVLFYPSGQAARTQAEPTETAAAPTHSAALPAARWHFSRASRSKSS